MTEITNPLYAHPRQVIHNFWISLKDDHDEEWCGFCAGSTFPAESMVVRFEEESTDEEDRPGSPAAVPAADGSQPVPEPVRFISDVLAVELQPWQRALAERVFAERERYVPGAVGHRDHPQRVPDDLEPELDPERVIHSVDYADAVRYAHRIALDVALYGSAYVDTDYPLAAEDGA